MCLTNAEPIGSEEIMRVPKTEKLVAWSYGFDLRHRTCNPLDTTQTRVCALFTWVGSISVSKLLRDIPEPAAIAGSRRV